jgi:hypothetical protein
MKFGALTEDTDCGSRDAQPAVQFVTNNEEPVVTAPQDKSAFAKVPIFR